MPSKQNFAIYDDDDEVEVLLNLEEYTPGRYVLYRFTDIQFYISSIVEVKDGSAILKGTITFTWPGLDDIFPAELTRDNVFPLPGPSVDRRGTSMTFKKSSFKHYPF